MSVSDDEARTITRSSQNLWPGGIDFYLGSRAFNDKLLQDPCRSYYFVSVRRPKCGGPPKTGKMVWNIVTVVIDFLSLS